MSIAALLEIRSITMPEYPVQMLCVSKIKFVEYRQGLRITSTNANA